MEKNNKTKVIVIGAGVAGLSCASTLIQNEKFDVTVLEARNRLGGRIDTKQFGPAVVDLGASWLHGISDNLLYNRGEEIGLKFRMTPEECEKLLQETDFNNIKFLPSPPVIDYHGKSMSHLYMQFNLDWGEVADEVEDFYDDNKDEHGLVSDKIKDMSVMDKMLEVAKKTGVDERLKKKLGETYNRLVQFSAQYQSGYYGGEMTSLSAKYMGFLHETGGDMLVLNGYMTAINYLAKNIDIKTNCQVSKIIYNKKDSKNGSHSITLETSAGQMTCDHVVVTVPLGCLKHNAVEFEPALPSRKQKAIDRLGAGLLDKVVLRFKKRFWEKDLGWLQVVPDGIGFTNFMNFFKKTMEPILVSFVSPEHGKIMETKEDNEVINEALGILKAYYGKKVEDLFEEGCVTKWWTDPFSRGSYSYLPVGSTPEDYTAMSEPICDDHVLFAGEHTTRSHPATVGGAYLSGQREASRLLEKYGCGADNSKENLQN